MNELDHSHLEYEGNPGEPVTMWVTAIGTTHNVVYKLDGGPSIPLPKGQPILFNFKNASGQRRDLQVTVDGTTPGSYEFVIENVANCSKPIQPGKCIRRRNAPPKKVSLFAFFTA